VYDGNTVFGFFPPSAFDRQAGVGSTAEERARLAVVSAGGAENADALVTSSQLQLPQGRLRMIDRVAYVDDTRVRTEKDVRPSDWYFKAHFYEDPVQPGSLGIEAMVQALQSLAMKKGVDRGMRAPRFQALAPQTTHTWRYRGQVVPSNTRVDVDVALVDVRTDEHGVLVIGTGALWVDGLRIYLCDQLALRVVDDG
jgi:3-hydroxymyristoyl/3-hydroxydecanoyl-(acyl carrier protein) dehydratase